MVGTIEMLGNNLNWTAEKERVTHVFAFVLEGVCRREIQYVVLLLAFFCIYFKLISGI